MADLGSRLKHAWNAFSKQETNSADLVSPTYALGATSYGAARPDRARVRFANERSIITAVYTRLAIDCAAIDIRHVRLDDKNRYLQDMDSGLNDCLTVEANLDQAGTSLRKDIVDTIFQEGSVAIVPVDTTIDPNNAGSFDIKSLRVGTIVQWFPQQVRVSVYNERVGRREEITLPKRLVGIVENPFYSVMNEPNSTLQRLITKLSMLDAVDEASSSGKLDLIIQLPYVIKSEARREQATQRSIDLQEQLKGSKYGIAYTDGTEKITQLNRPAENNLLAQVTYLTDMLFGQLGLTPEIMNGTADEAVMLNYMNRTVGPVVNAVVEEMRRKFLTKTARSQKQSILFFREPFKLVPISQIAEIADKFTRNEIMSSNELRQVIGMSPSKDPKADMLVNSNMPNDKTGVAVPSSSNAPVDTTVVDNSAVSSPDDVAQNALDSVDTQLGDLLTSLGGDPNSNA